MNILTKFLEKIGKPYEELNTAEKATYDNWERQLVATNLPITIEQLASFLKKEIEVELVQLLTPEVKLNNPTDIFLKAQLKNNRMLLAFLKSPEKGRNLLREYIEKRTESIIKRSE